MSVQLGGNAGTNSFNARSMKQSYPRWHGNRTNKRVSEQLNYIDFNNENDYIFNLYSSRFLWGVEKLNMTSAYPEKMLYLSPFVVFYRSKTLGWLLLPAAPAGYNAYGEPTAVNAFGYNGFSETVAVDYDKMVLLYDNPAFVPPEITFCRYAQLIADTGRSCEVYSAAMKKPVTFFGSFDEAKSIQTIMDNLQRNEMYMFIDESLLIARGEKGLVDNDELREIRTFQTDHNSADLMGLHQYKLNLIEEVRCKLGIEVNHINKAAQVTEDEANKSDSTSNLILLQALTVRKKAVEKMNKLAPELDITVELSPALQLQAAPNDKGSNKSNPMDSKED